MKIIKFYAENVKRLTAVEITPDGALIQITGKNGQGKTSVLDAIWWALGGAKNIQSVPIRKGETKAVIKITLGDSEPELLVERRITEKGEYLFVRNADGSRRDKPEEVLRGLLGALTFDPLGFMRDKPAQQFAVLRGLVDLGDGFDSLDIQKQHKFDERTDTNRRVKSAQMRADAIIVPDDLPESEPDIKAITDRLTSASDHNERVRDMIAAEEAAITELANAKADIERLEGLMFAARARLSNAEDARDEVRKVEIPQPIDAAAVRAELDAANVTRAAFAKRQQKIDALAEAATEQAAADALTADIEKIDATKAAALTQAKMPVDGLTFGDGVVFYNGLPLDQASDAEQLRVSTAIAAANNPKLRIIRIRDGSLLDEDGLKTLAAFAEANDFQIWLEKVDSSGEIGIVMEDGHIKGQILEPQPQSDAPETAANSAQEPTEEQAARAAAYMDQMLAKLPGTRDRAEVEQLHAEIKVKLVRFPQLVANKWTVPYLERLKGVK